MKPPHPIPGTERIEITDLDITVVLGVVQGEPTRRVAANEQATIKVNLRGRMCVQGPEWA